MRPTPQQDLPPIVSFLLFVCCSLDISCETSLTSMFSDRTGQPLLKCACYALTFFFVVLNAAVFAGSNDRGRAVR